MASLHVASQQEEEVQQEQPPRSEDGEIAMLLKNFLMAERHRERVFTPRFRLRLDIASAWAVEAGSSVLDIGCGHGESSLTLALRLGPRAHIAGIDPAVPEYGSPHTVAEARNFILRTAFGRQITFARTDAEALLAGPARDEARPRFDAATLCLSLWYFPTRASVESLFHALARARIPKVYIAEYDFSASRGRAQIPHVLAARAQARLHASKAVRHVADPREPNVRAALEVHELRKAAAGAGWEVIREGHVRPAPDMLEGHYEAQYVLSDAFEAAVRKEKVAQEEDILATVCTLRKAMDDLGEGGATHVQAMDIWWAEMCSNGTEMH